MQIDQFARPMSPDSDILDWMASLPTVAGRTNAATTFKVVVEALGVAKSRDLSRIWGIGPHVIKYGLSPLIIDLIEKGWVSAMATSGAGAIHDIEIALIGETSEEMSSRIATGDFGMAQETGELLSRSAALAAQRGVGYGQAIAEVLEETGAPYREHSLLWQAFNQDIPMTVHVAFGTDIVHMHPSMNGATTGEATLTDFAILAAAVDNLAGGGVHMNVASSVVLPEVFLKALTVANNLRSTKEQQPVGGFLTVAVDQESRYRPLMNVVRRPTEGVGDGRELLGRLELLLPMLAWALTALSDLE